MFWVVWGKMIVKTAYREILPYRTKDGSLIRELMHPGSADKQKASAICLVVQGR
jgi:hypothetical protein